MKVSGYFMKTTIVILTLLFSSCSTDKKPENNNAISQTDITTYLDTTDNNITRHSNQIPLTIIPGKGVDN